MAKTVRKIDFSKAEIDKENMLIVEHLKDEDKCYSIDKLLSDWSGIKGLSISISQNEEVKPDKE